MDLKNIINKKGEYADYMLKEITHICKDMDKRDPGSKGEKQACEYMADVLKNECGCERADVESFKENPGSFFGWIYFTITFVLAAIVLFFFCPIISVFCFFVPFFTAFSAEQSPSIFHGKHLEAFFFHRRAKRFVADGRKNFHKNRVARHIGSRL